MHCACCRRRRRRRRCRCLISCSFQPSSQALHACHCSCLRLVSLPVWGHPHTQLSTWDCGLACLQMVLNAVHRPQSRQALLTALDTRSVWTIDLALALADSGIRFLFCTRTIEVSADFSAIDYYTKDFEADSRRVVRCGCCLVQVDSACVPHQQFQLPVIFNSDRLNAGKTEALSECFTRCY